MSPEKKATDSQLEYLKVLVWILNRLCPDYSKTTVAFLLFNREID
jgi:hypothetical protein